MRTWGVITLAALLAACLSTTSHAQGRGRGSSGAQGMNHGPPTAPQQGSGRLSRDLNPQRSSGDRGRSFVHRDEDARMAKGKGPGDKTSRPGQDAGPSHPDKHVNDGRGPGPRIDPHREALQKQLAAIERLRDQAVETGDTQLLDRADQMEREARERFARHEAKRTEFEPGLGRETARQARGLETWPHEQHPEMAPGVPGYGRMTAEGRPATPRVLPPAEPAPTQPPAGEPQPAPSEPLPPATPVPTASGATGT